MENPPRFSISQIHVECTWKMVYISYESIIPMYEWAKMYCHQKWFEICVFIHKSTFICLYFVNAQWIVFDGLNSWRIHTTVRSRLFSILHYLSISLTRPLYVCYTFRFPDSGYYAQKIDFHEYCVTVLFIECLYYAHIIVTRVEKYSLIFHNTILWKRITSIHTKKNIIENRNENTQETTYEK